MTRYSESREEEKRRVRRKQRIKRFGSLLGAAAVIAVSLITRRRVR